MALDKLVDGAKLDACLDAEADAIRAKTGGSTPILFDFVNNKGFADAIAAIPSGGGVTTQPLSVTENGTYTAPSGTAYTPVTVNVPSGASLPSVISKIDGGSFTLASDTAGDRQSVSHSLGVVPKGFVIWTVDEFSGTVATRYMANCFVLPANIVDKNSNNYVATGAATMTYNGNVSVMSSNTLFTTATVQNYMNSERIRWNNSLLFYKAGVEYKWLAWA